MMQELKKIFANNLIAVRTALGWTQLELANELHYSDKAVSKWERAESIPDITVLMQLAKLGHVTVDWLVTEHGEEEKPPVEPTASPTATYRGWVIMQVAVVGIYALVMVAFVLLWILNVATLWQMFVWAFPASCVVVVVLDSLWYRGRANKYAISAFIWSTLCGIYVTTLHTQNNWQIFLIGIPAQIIVLLSFMIRRRRLDKKSNDESKI